MTHFKCQKKKKRKTHVKKKGLWKKERDSCEDSLII